MTGDGTDRDAAFRDFVVATYGSLVRTGYLLLGDRGLAEDLVQSALVRAHSKWSAIRDVASAEAYTRRIMIRLSVRWRRRAWRAEIPSGLVSENAARNAAQNATTDDDLSLAVRQALSRLSAKQRAVIVARYYADLTEAQTADLLGCSLGTVKSRASRAMSALREDGLLGKEMPRHG